jgi:hypothetical protein
MHTRTAACFPVAVPLGAAAFAQDAELRFDVASIKQSEPSTTLERAEALVDAADRELVSHSGLRNG